MCGRFYVDQNIIEELGPVVRKIDREIKGQKIAGDVFPMNPALVIEEIRSAMGISCKRWGYPSIHGKGLVINARAESVLKKQMFRNGIRCHRIVVPASGFYEWNHNREKNIFMRKDSRILFMAGFYDRFENEDRFVILTTAANESVKKVHDRMPLILEENQLTAWLEEDGMTECFLRQTPVQLERCAEYEQQTLEWGDI